MALTVGVAAVALTAGIIASSIALIGLGLESAIGLLASGIVVWQLRGGGEDRDTRAIRLIGMTFLAGAVYLLAESIHELASHTHSEHSAAGIAVAAAALIVLPVLALAKRRAGQALGSRTLIADAAETALSAAAAAAALLGVGLDTWLGWLWAVPAAGLAIAILAFLEAIEIWRHRH
jgi:divalent metal cation (Fe/Co/Zn/Cd) transporter